MATLDDARVVPERDEAVLPRCVALPGDRTLRIRPVTTTDADGLVALYQDLGTDDLYRRFFQGHMPPRSVIESMTSVEQRGGFRVVAEMEGADAEPRIVGECAYELLPDGDGELAITVARHTRGWLGPYLLDTVVRVAAERGIANLQADVLVDNHRMLALIRARGYAIMDHYERPSIVRVVIGTAQRMPTWPRRADRLRVLVEVPGGRSPVEAAARAAGFEVLACPGPLSDWSRCPAVAGQPCPLAQDADLIVDAVRSDGGLGASLLEAHDTLHPGIPLCVEYASATGRPAAGRPAVTHDMDDTAVVHLLQGLARSRQVPPGR